MRMQRKWCRSLKAWKSLVVTLSCMLVTTKYKSSESYSGKCVLVVGCGNLGMEVLLRHVEHLEAIFISIEKTFGRSK
jgi:hypothetical protein